MPINIQDNFRVNVGLPIDSRIVASGSSGRSAIPTHTRYMFFYQFLMTPATLAGYISEIFKRKRVWK